jgi:hypothetical protein
MAALAGVAALSPSALAQSGSGPSGPTYQRQSSFAGQDPKHRGDWRRRPMPTFSSRTSAASFQRPYPYHLDYYRAKWGGSYAPYFGNLYGPPNYFFNGTPFFGGFAPFYGFNTFGQGGFDNRFGGFGGSGFGGPGFDGQGFGGPGFGGGPNWGGAPYGPWSGQGMGPIGMPVEGTAVSE